MSAYTQDDFEREIGEIYPKDGERLLERCAALLTDFTPRASATLSCTEPTLICYADSILDTAGGKRPLEALHSFLQSEELSSDVPIVHLLPFYPWDTDRGFSVKDYYSVDPRNGTWEDVEQLANDFALMFDYVANHASIDNRLVQSALIERHIGEDDPRYAEVSPYKDFVVAYDSLTKPTEKQLSLLARPRAYPAITLYTVYEDTNQELSAILGDVIPPDAKALGSGYVWTTFSRGKDSEGREETRQVDLNFRNPEVFLEVCKILLFYLEKGGQLIRLDAIGYIWKQLGSHSLHEPEAHAIIRCLSHFLRTAHSAAVSIAEVNEPQEKAFTYLGDSEQKECDMVYQFTHFPLSVHALHSENVSYYRDWLTTLDWVEGRQFVTLLGSHDGLGMKPLRGILPEDELDRLGTLLVEEHGCLANYAKLPGGKEIIYEVCATPWHLVNNLSREESFETRLNRYLAVVRLGFLVRGIPGVYLTGLLGAGNYLPDDGLDENRTVNRERYELPRLKEQLTGQQGKTYQAVRKLLQFRREQPAFHCLHRAAAPLESFRKGILFCHLPGESAEEDLYLVQNVSSESVNSEEALGTIPHLATPPRTIEPYQGFWLNTERVFD